MRGIAVDASHPSEEEVAAYLSGGLDAGEREALQAHLAECRDCRAQVTAAERLLRARAGRSRRALAVTAVAAAAVLALVVLAPRDRTSLGGDRERDGEPGAVPRLEAVRPPDGATIRRKEVAFTWRSQPGDPLYRVTVTTSGGEAVWTRDTPDTTAAPPDSLRLVPGARYFWYVDALDAAGTSITSGPRTVRIAP
jgi:hypothetical protein